MAACCDYSPGEELDECMDKYEYCTNGAEYLIYKEFTAPPFQCKETNVVTHSTLD